MKKLLYCVSAMALAFFAASCQQENLEPTSGANTVTYTVQVPDAIATKAIGDEITDVDKVYYEVYREADIENGQPVYEGSEDVDANGRAKFTLEFVKKQDYIVLFWAQNSALVNTDPTSKKGMYNISDLRAVKLVNPGAANNVSAQVFAGKDVVSDCVSDANGNVPLTRPVSQINVFTTKESLNLRGSQISLVKSSMTVSGMYNTYNVAEGSAVVGNEAKYIYSSALVPETKDTDEYAYVAMNYVGFAYGENTIVNVDFTIETSESESKLIPHSVSNVPVKPNYRTNIIGNLITATTDYNVSLNDNWVTPSFEVEVVNSVAELASIFEELNDPNSTVTKAEVALGADMDLSELFNLGASTFATKAGETAPLPIVIPEGKTVVLNLNGYNVTVPEQSAGKHYYAFENHGDLTITSSNLKGSISARGIFNYGTMILESGTINAIDGNGGYGVRNYEGAEFVMNGGTVATIYEDGDIPGEGYDASPIRVDEGAKAEINGGIINNVSNFTVAIDNYGETIVDGGTFTTVHTTLANSAVMTINGGSFTCNGLEGITAHALWAAAGTTTINGGTFNGKDNYNGFNVDADEGAVVNITGGEFLPVHSGSLYGDGTINVTGGTFFDNPSARLVPGYKATQNEEGEYYVVTKMPDVAKIGETGYWSLNAAVAAVQDGETITLVADEMFTPTNYFDNGGWKDGLGYSGDKSFTIDLGGNTIKQDGSLNDYLVWIKNVGSKENTITFKNGTMDAGKTAYCALCTASSHENKLTVNLENITLINNNSNGSTVKIRTGSELNVNNGTKIIGQNSYLGIENWKAVVNIHDGAEIYMNGTSSYNGCLVGVGGNGTVNVYGGYGKGVSGGLIAMTSGGTINAMGGEWIANTDGTYANSNKSVLVAQSDKQYNAGAGNAVVNVTGGTYKGGYNCYGNAVGDAQINISGGNFNADPMTYLAKGCEANEVEGIWTVRILPVAKIGETEYETLEAAVAAAKAGDTITVLRDATLSAELTLPANVTLNGNGKQINGTIYAGGNLTFAGHTKVTSFSASYYDRIITIGEGACLEVTGTGRVSLAYGNTFNITGNVIDAKAADKSTIKPSLIIPGGISITGGSDATMNVTNAYIKVGDTSSKNSAANGTFNINFTNAIAEFTHQFTMAVPTNSKNPNFNVNITNSVLTTATKFVAAAPGCNVVIDNSEVTLGTYFRNSGVFTVKNGSVLTGSTTQFGENGGNDGELIVDASEVTINASSAGHALDGKGTGSITLKNGANAEVTYYKGITVNADATSTFTGTDVK